MPNHKGPSAAARSRVQVARKYGLRVGERTATRIARIYDDGAADGAERVRGVAVPHLKVIGELAKNGLDVQDLVEEAIADVRAIADKAVETALNGE